MRISDWSSDVCSSDLLQVDSTRTVNIDGAETYTVKQQRTVHVTDGLMKEEFDKGLNTTVAAKGEIRNITGLLDETPTAGETHMVTGALDQTLAGNVNQTITGSGTEPEEQREERGGGG